MKHNLGAKTTQGGVYWRVYAHSSPRLIEPVCVAHLFPVSSQIQVQILSNFPYKIVHQSALHCNEFQRSMFSHDRVWGDKLLQVQNYECKEILIVEDHAITAGLLVPLLEGGFPTFAVRVAASAEEALVAFRPEFTRLVVMDIQLPRMNGIDAVQQIRMRSAAVGIVMHSSLESAIHKEASYAVGANAFVSKTNTFKELIPAIAALLAAPPTAGLK